MVSGQQQKRNFLATWSKLQKGPESTRKKLHGGRKACWGLVKESVQEQSEPRVEARAL